MNSAVFFDAVYELWQAILMMLFIGGMIGTLVVIGEWRKNRRKRNRYVIRDTYKPIDREPYSKSYSHLHKMWRQS